MKQSRGTSFIKSVVSTAVGFGVAYIANMIILPWFGLPISHSANFLLTSIYTVISIVRGYALERAYEAMGWRTRMSAFALAVLAERQRQITHEGYDEHHDSTHTWRELACAGAAYFVGHSAGRLLWPWADGFKPDPYDTRRDLVRGCALGFAAGELCDRNRKRKRKPDLGGGYINKGGHNDWPSQVTKRPPPPPASNPSKASVIPPTDQQPQLSPESKSAA